MLAFVRHLGFTVHRMADDPEVMEANAAALTAGVPSRSATDATARLNARSQSASAATTPPASSIPTWTMAFCTQPSECTRTPSASRISPEVPPAASRRGLRQRFPERRAEKRGDPLRIRPRIAGPAGDRLAQGFHVADLERGAGVHLRPAAKAVEAEHRRVQFVHQRDVGADDAFQQILARAQCLPVRSGYPAAQPRPRRTPGTASSSGRTSRSDRGRTPSDPQDRPAAPWRPLIPVPPTTSPAPVPDTGPRPLERRHHLLGEPFQLLQRHRLRARRPTG